MLWIKKIRKRKLQSILIVFMLLICSMLMASSVVIITSLKAPIHKLKKETKAADVIVYPVESDTKTMDEWKNDLSQLDSVDHVTVTNRHNILETLMYKEKKMEVFASLVEFDDQTYGNIRIQGNAAKSPKEGECFIPAVLRNEYGIDIGDELRLYNDNKEYKYVVSEVFSEPYSVSLSYQISILVEKLPEELSKESFLQAYCKDGATGEDIVDDYLKTTDGLLGGNFYTIEDRMSNCSITENIMGGILLVISIIIFLVCCIMIRYMIRNSLIQDKKSIAVYKAIGYSSKDIMTMYLKYYLFLSSIGSFIGIQLSRFISNAFMNRTFKNLLVDSMPSILIQGIICFIVINVLAFLQIRFTLSKMKKFKPVEILNNRESSLGIKKRKNNRITEKLQFSPLGMALRMLQRDKKNTCYIILTCFLTIYMVFFSLVSLSNIDKMKENNYYWIGFDQYDVSLSAVNVAEFEEQCQEFIKDDAVTRLIRNNMEVRISIKWQKGSSNAIVYETYENINMPVVKGRNPKYSNEIVLSNIIARELKKKIGDYVDIYLQDKKISLLVVGTYQSFYNMGRGVRMLGSTFEENNIPYVYNEASVYLKRQVDKDKFIEEYQRKYVDSLKITDRVKKYGTIFDNICNPQKMALGPFMTFVIMIGCINLLYIIFLKNLSNKKSYSIYKSIGYTAGDLIKMNLWYVGIIATASLLIALPIFITLYPVVMTLSMSMFGFEDYMISIQPTVIAMGSIGMLLTFLVSVILSSRNLYTSIVSELAEE